MKNLGKEITIKQKDGKELKGKLLAFNGGPKIEVVKKEKGKKQLIKQEKNFLMRYIRLKKSMKNNGWKMMKRCRMINIKK